MNSVVVAVDDSVQILSEIQSCMVPIELRSLIFAYALPPDLFSPQQYADEAVVASDLLMVQHLVIQFVPAGSIDIRFTAKLAAASGQLAMLEWIHWKHEWNALFASTDFVQAAEAGSLTVMKWLLSRYGLTRAMVNPPPKITSGHPGCLDSSRLPRQWYMYALMYICKAGNLEQLKWIVEALEITVSEIRGGEVIGLLCTHEHLTCLRWVVWKFQFKVDESVEIFVPYVYGLSVKGRLEMLKWLVEGPVRLPKSVIPNPGTGTVEAAKVTAWLLIH
jgi:hypothetical protein